MYNIKSTEYNINHNFYFIWQGKCQGASKSSFGGVDVNLNKVHIVSSISIENNILKFIDFDMTVEYEQL